METGMGVKIEKVFLVIDSKKALLNFNNKKSY